MNKALTIKNQQYESTIKKIITNIIFTEIYDSTIKMATITDVKLTNDKSIVKIFVDCYDKIHIDKLLKKINGAAGYFRSVLARELNWRKIPQVIFVKDSSREKYEEVDQLIKIWKEKNNE